jgi:sterol carrier protein 2
LTENDLQNRLQIMNSAKIHDPLTKLQCCPTSDGSAAAIVASEKFVIEHGLQSQVRGRAGGRFFKLGSML